ncbi:metal-dependent hydrolase [Staphylococcus haemolyticus]|uniref:metal-dependent hydrolase n=1 Tax=Staphylococcus haemolyticus TaxID=1283 RepID=UPI00069FDF3E|nr:metal-dependent hydrolase [Staphylococcus haemolyticus]
MTGKTHVSAGLLVGALTTEHFQTDLFSTVTVICLSVVSSLLPDICHTGSKIGRKLKLLSLIIRLLFGHRTFTHSLLFIGIIVFLLNLIQTPTYYLVSIIGGMASHVILDMLTQRGVKLLYPIPLTIKFPFTFKTGGLVDVSLATALSIGALYILFQTSISHLLKYISQSILG